MFLLVSVRHVVAHLGGYQHGVSIQISINLGKTFLRISRIRNILLAWILPRNLVYLPPFISQIRDLIYWTVLIFILICFEWRDTENQQYFPRCTAGSNIVTMGHFRVPSGLCFKTRVGAQPLISLGNHFFILMQIKLIFTRKVVHLDSFWKWGFLELGSGLLEDVASVWTPLPTRTQQLPTLLV